MTNHLPTPRLLLLWDIDHTLIETRGVGTQFYRQAFEIVTGRAVEHQVEVTGRTEQAIFAEALQLHGIQETDELQASYAEELGRQYQQQRALLLERGRMLPGAREALAAMADRPGIVQSVLTGNLKAVARVKLGTFDLDRYIDFESGAFGEDDPERTKLVAVAQARAGARYAADFAGTRRVVFGDTPNDVEAARAGGVAFVGVASGRHSEADLRTAGAAEVLPTLTDTTRVADAILTAAGLCNADRRKCRAGEAQSRPARQDVGSTPDVRRPLCRSRCRSTPRPTSCSSAVRLPC